MHVLFVEPPAFALQKVTLEPAEEHRNFSLTPFDRRRSISSSGHSRNSGFEAETHQLKGANLTNLPTCLSSHKVSHASILWCKSPQPHSMSRWHSILPQGEDECSSFQRNFLFVLCQARRPWTKTSSMESCLPTRAIAVFLTPALHVINPFKQNSARTKHAHC